MMRCIGDFPTESRTGNHHVYVGYLHQRKKKKYSLPKPKHQECEMTMNIENQHWKLSMVGKATKQVLITYIFADNLFIWFQCITTPQLFFTLNLMKNRRLIRVHCGSWECREVLDKPNYKQDRKTF
jgi:hypothetical protein